jgi:hypothetical protein
LKDEYEVAKNKLADIWTRRCNAKSSELDTTWDEYQLYLVETQAHIQGMNQEIDYLYTYVSNLTLILNNVDKGRYSVKSSFGITRYHIPDMDRSLAKLNFERCEKLKCRIREVEIINAKLPSKTPNGSSKPAYIELKQDHVRESVLDELSSRETVQYIRELEDERDFYKKASRDAMPTSAPAN